MLLFDFKCPYTLLSGYLDYAIDNAFGKDKYETHGVSLKLERRGDSFMNIDGNVIFINTISDLEVYKSVGLFSSEIKGVIDINLAIQYDISSDFRITTKTDILNHKWIEKPTLEIGILNMPVETLVELALKHYEVIITAKMDAVVKDNVDLKSIIKNQLGILKQQLNEKTFHGVKLSLNPTLFTLEKPRYNNNIISTSGGIVLDSAVAKESTLIDQPLKFKWVDQIVNDNILLTNFEFDEAFLLEIFNEQIGNQEIGGKLLVLSNSTLKLSDNKIVFRSKITSPLKADLLFSATPLYMEANQHLELENIEVKISPESFLYKLSAPLVNKFVENKLDSVFPLDIKKLIEENIYTKMPETIKVEKTLLSPKVKSIVLSKLSFREDKIIGIVRTENPHLSIEMLEGSGKLV